MLRDGAPDARFWRSGTQVFAAVQPGPAAAQKRLAKICLAPPSAALGTRARAGVGLAPPELWLLARLGERAPLTEPQLAEQLQEDAHRIDEALEQLQQRSLVESSADATITLTMAGREDYERLVAARCAGLRELLAGWSPDQRPELQRLVDRLGRDLVSEIPTPPPVSDPGRV